MMLCSSIIESEKAIKFNNAMILELNNGDRL